MIHLQNTKKAFLDKRMLFVEKYLATGFLMAEYFLILLIVFMRIKIRIKSESGFCYIKIGFFILNFKFNS